MIVYKVIRKHSRRSACIQGPMSLVYSKGKWIKPVISDAPIMAFRHEHQAELFAQVLEVETPKLTVIRCEAVKSRRRLFPTLLIAGVLVAGKPTVQRCRKMWAPRNQKELPWLLRAYHGTVLCSALKPLE
jgi:hypothetical protein